MPFYALFILNHICLQIIASIKEEECEALLKVRAAASDGQRSIIVKANADAALTSSAS